MTKTQKKILKEAFLQVEREELATIKRLIPDKVIEPSNSFKAKINEIINGTKNEHVRRAPKRLAIVLLSLIVAFTLAMSVSAIRQRVVDFIISIYENGISVVFERRNAGENHDLEEVYSPTYLPEGYTIVENKNLGTKIERKWNNGVGEISYLQSNLSGDLNIDNENVEEIELDCQGLEVYCSLKYGKYKAYWSDDKYLYIMGFSSNDISIEEIEKIIMSVKKEN